MQEQTCPVCLKPINLNDRRCKNCGVDLALAAGMTQKAPTATSRQAKAVSPEVLVPRLGDYLVQKQLITAENLAEALRFQKSEAVQGRTVLVGQALVRLGLLEQQDLDAAITEQIFLLQGMLQKANKELEKRVQERTSELESTLSKLTEINQLKSDFVANISHELRTPMTHIKGYIELLGDGSLGSLNQDQLEAVDVLNRASQRLQNLIEDLIKFSESSQGTMNLRLTPVSVPDLVQRIMMESYQKAQDRKIQFDSSIEPGLPLVDVDEENITWVLNQLVDNAIKFTQVGGRILLSAKRSGQRVVLAVLDTGIGIPKNRISEIFEAFHQLDGSATRQAGGTGLGLALVKKIVEAHGAAIEVQSQEGKGSRFAFSLAVSQKQVKASVFTEMIE